MSKILDQLPYSDAIGRPVVCGEEVSVHAHQIIVWVSLSARDSLQLAEDAPKIPAILDTGNTFGFSIAEQQLVRWCGMQPRSLETLGPVLINNQRLNRHSADVWLHPNQPKRRDSFRREPPFRLELRDGIVLFREQRSLVSGLICGTFAAFAAAGFKEMRKPQPLTVEDELDDEQPQ
jgi:hypothetical protein